MGAGDLPSLLRAADPLKGGGAEMLGAESVQRIWAVNPGRPVAGTHVTNEPAMSLKISEEQMHCQVSARGRVDLILAVSVMRTRRKSKETQCTCCQPCPLL